MISKKISVPFNYLPYEFKNPDQIIKGWRKLIKSNEFTLGKYVNSVERNFSKYFKCKYVIAVNSGTDALILALKALNVKAGDEVITAANTFYATAGAIVACGAKPVLIDVDDNFQLDPVHLAKRISFKTKVIIPVYWGGAIPKIKKIIEIAKKFKVKVVEDACMGIGGKVNTKHPGTFGDIGCFSFHPLKTINAIGDGGLVCTNNKKLFSWMQTYRNHGMVDRDNIKIWGVNMRMQPLQCIVVLEGLKKINKIIKIRNKNAEYMDKCLKKINNHVIIPKRYPDCRETFALYMIRVKKRNKLLSYLNQKGVEAKIHYPVPLCLQSPYKKQNNKHICTNAIKHSKELLTLPIHQYLRRNQLKYTVNCIKSFYGK